MDVTTDTTMTVTGIGVGRIVAIFAGFLVLGLMVLVYASFQGDIRQARERIAAGSQIAVTACGQIEYAVAGDGPTVLAVHGAGGGYDQGLDVSRGLVQNGFRVVAISRFGYLRSPLPADASPAAQADAYACLLDALDIKRVAIFGLSAGGPSAMQFALRYPERTSALVLLAPAAYPTSQAQRADGAVPKQVSALTKIIFDIALKSDFLFWAAPHIAPKAVDQALLGTPPEVIEGANTGERAMVAETLDHLLPFSARRLGVLNDASITPFLPRYELERISAPTLTLSAADDGYGTYAGARYSAEHIPNARFIGYPSGGHLLVGHSEEAKSEILSFLERYGR